MKIPITSIIQTDRQRQDLGDIQGLAESIKRYGIIHPPVVSRNPDNISYTLVAGGRRTAACLHLGYTEIEVNFREELSLEDIHELELEENLRRKSLTWQEHVLAIDDLHSKRCRKAALSGSEWFRDMTGEMLGCSRGSVNNAIRMAQELRKDLKKAGIWTCDSASDALKYLLKKQVDDATAELARRTIATANAQPVSVPTPPDLGDLYNDSPIPASTDFVTHWKDTSHRIELETLVKNGIPKGYIFGQYRLVNEIAYMGEYNEEFPIPEFEQWYNQTLQSLQTVIPLLSMLTNQSCLQYMSSRGPAWCDHIITDPPYAIDMDMLEQASGGIQNIEDVADEHNVLENKCLLDAFIRCAYTSLKDNGFLVFWCDQMQWQYCYDIAMSCGFKVQRWPLTWVKTSSCKNGAALKNFTKNTEIAMVCRKGNASLAMTAATSVVQGPHDEMRETFGHPFVKPFIIWEFIARHICQPNSYIYEPFAGRGSGVISLLRMGHRVCATEMQENHFNHLIQNVKSHYISSLGEHNVTFK